MRVSPINMKTTVDQKRAVIILAVSLTLVATPYYFGLTFAALVFPTTFAVVLWSLVEILLLLGLVYGAVAMCKRKPVDKHKRLVFWLALLGFIAIGVTQIPQALKNSQAKKALVIQQMNTVNP